MIFAISSTTPQNPFITIVTESPSYMIKSLAQKALKWVDEAKQVHSFARAEFYFIFAIKRIIPNHAGGLRLFSTSTVRFNAEMDISSEVLNFHRNDIDNPISHLIERVKNVNGIIESAKVKAKLFDFNRNCLIESSFFQ